MTHNIASREDRWLTLPWDAVVVHYHEIALKRGNRGPFLRRLEQNLRQVLNPLSVEVRNLRDRLLVPTGPDTTAQVLSAAMRVFGVSYAAPVRFLPRDIEALSEAAVQCYQAVASDGASFAIRARRVDKSFPVDSSEIMRSLGQAVVDTTGAPVDLGQPDITITFRVYEDQVYLIGPPYQGPNGLPTGVTGKVLTLFSGGIDSPVATWLMMRRGCESDFVHFHVYPKGEAVGESKIPGLIEQLLRPQALTARLYLVPYHTFQLHLVQASVPDNLELVLFRRYMLRVAAALATKHKHRALVTGDNLAQVASQTMANLAALQDVTEHLVFRPLLTHNKKEIVTLARQIGTYELAIEEYKDCCSLIARHPRIHPRLAVIQRVEEALPVDRILEEALTETETWTLGQPHVPSERT